MNRGRLVFGTILFDQKLFNWLLMQMCKERTSLHQLCHNSSRTFCYRLAFLKSFTMTNLSEQFSTRTRIFLISKASAQSLSVSQTSDSPMTRHRIHTVWSTHMKTHMVQ